MHSMAKSYTIFQGKTIGKSFSNIFEIFHCKKHGNLPILQFAKSLKFEFCHVYKMANRNLHFPADEIENCKRTLILNGVQYLLLFLIKWFSIWIPTS